MAELKLTDANFQAEVIKAARPVLVDFFADWCGPCQLLAPVISEIAEENADKIIVGKVNVDEQAALAEQFGIEVIPTLLVFEGGKIKRQATGFMSKEDLLQLAGL